MVIGFAVLKSLEIVPMFASCLIHRVLLIFIESWSARRLAVSGAPAHLSTSIKKVLEAWFYRLILGICPFDLLFPLVIVLLFRLCPRLSRQVVQYIALNPMFSIKRIVYDSSPVNPSGSFMFERRS